MARKRQPGEGGTLNLLGSPKLPPRIFKMPLTLTLSPQAGRGNKGKVGMTI
jgi:hypothetical protein